MLFHNDILPLHDDYLRECRYVKNLAPKTIQSYRHCMRMLLPFLEQTQCNWPKAVMLLAETERRNAGGLNIIVRSAKPFLKWLHENGHIDRPVTLKKQKEPRILISVLNGEQIEKVIHYKPKCDGKRRAHMLALCILDGGYRIDELLKLKASDIDWENSLVQVRGKGSRERKVPMSLEVRRRLYYRIQQGGNDYVFSAVRGTGRPAGYRIADRDLKSIGDDMGIPGLRFHQLRHTMATHYIKAGGDVVRLQRILGHSQITTTMRYIHIQTEDLTRAHEQLSVLGRSVK